MKKYIVLILASLLFISCNKEIKRIVINNPTLDERYNNLVEIPIDSLGISDFSNVILCDEDGNEVAYQVTPKNVVFLVANIRGGMQTSYTFEQGEPSAIAPKVSARYVPERKDDFAWENENAAYRMYGPALADENPSNGVDLWSKCVDELVVDSFYYRDLTLGFPYHVNYGKGFDGYKVGHTLGCGGFCPIKDGHLLVGNHYNNYHINYTGPLQSCFTLEYDTYTITITVSSQQYMCKAEVLFNESILDEENSTTIALAAGIYLHDRVDNIQYCIPGGWLAYAETATSDNTSYEMNGQTDMGRTFGAVYLPGAEDITIIDNTICAITQKDIAQENTLTYYFGGAWSEGTIKTDSEWFSAIAAETQHIKQPLNIQYTIEVQ